MKKVLEVAIGYILGVLERLLAREYLIQQRKDGEVIRAEGGGHRQKTVPGKI